jgi:transcriptional regulator with GAF, ATPase, and Fis domain
VSVTAGPDRGASFLLDGTRPPRVLVGTSPACDVKLADPHVSRRHLALDLGGPLLRIVDQGSRNGTFVGGVQLVEALFRGGETITLGDTSLRIDLVPGAPAALSSRSISFGPLLGASEEMRRLHPRLATLAAANVPLVIEGETGTGKEVLAEAIHEKSPRAAKPFVIFDCSAVSATMLESDLFGHQRGAFTGAISDRRGVFEEANGGTLLIDEIGELELPLQMKLLRALESGEVRRVGGTKWVKVDVRVIAATRRDLDAEVEQGRFRDDLYFRLAVGRIELPPLRRRKGDIPLLVDHFVNKLGGDPSAITPELLERFEAYSWPGNVRELANVVARHLALGETELGTPGLLAEATDATPAVTEANLDAVFGEVRDLPFPHAKARVLAAFEAAYVEYLVQKHGTVARATTASGLARRYFQQLRARHAK